MQVYFDLENLPTRPRALSIGVFDGVHIGHRALLKQLVSEAQTKGLTTLVITFSNHPQSVLQPPAPPLLTTIEERLSLLSEIGLDEVLVLPFTPQLAHHTAEQFCHILVDKIGCRLLIIGDDFALGYRREGTPSRLMELGQQLGFELKVVPAVQNASLRVSSTVIRQLLLDGKLEEAQTLLGYPYRLTGQNERGSGRGHQLGFPTVNVRLPSEKLLPRYGVYAAFAWVLEKRWRAAVYIGRRLTFDESCPVVEAHLLGYKGTVPLGAPITLELVAFVRPEQRFTSPEALSAQIQRDLKKIEESLAKAEGVSAAKG